MPGYNQQQLNYKVESGNQVALLIGDQLIGFAQTVSPTLDTGAESLFGVGSPRPLEIQQLRFSPSISIDNFLLTEEGLQYFGITTPLSFILCNNSFDLFVLNTSGDAILSYVGCVANNWNLNVPTNAIITQAITFSCLDVLDNSGKSILNGPAALNLNPLASAAGSSYSVPGQS